MPKKINPEKVRKPSIRELYDRYRTIPRQNIVPVMAEAYGAVTHLRSQIAAQQRSLDRQALELWFHLLMHEGEGKTVEEARAIVHAKPRSWDAGDEERI